jgi:hypothetical protein
MLVAQAHIHLAIVKFHERNASKDLVVIPIPADERDRFYWLKSPACRSSNGWKSCLPWPRHILGGTCLGCGELKNGWPKSGLLHTQ